MNKTLVILAAGMGSRFGGLKQLEKVGPNGEYIIDYSVYDALCTGFNKIVFVIKRENYEVFKSTIGKRIKDKIAVRYVFQESSYLPVYNEILVNREKPLGTAHAIYCCKDVVKEPFMIINADDFYGRDAYEKGFDFLENQVSMMNYGIISYNLLNTVTDFGEVKRGICRSSDGYLSSIVESTVRKKDDGLLVTPIALKKVPYMTDGNDLTSMNMIVFDNNIFDYIGDKIVEYMKKNADNLKEYEFLLPDMLHDGIREGVFRCKLVDTSSVWHGLTYKEDLGNVKNCIGKLIEDGIYPKNLWK